MLLVIPSYRLIMEHMKKELTDLFENKVAATRATPIDVIYSENIKDSGKLNHPTHCYLQSVNRWWVVNAHLLLEQVVELKRSYLLCIYVGPLCLTTFKATSARGGTGLYVIIECEVSEYINYN